MNRTDRLYALVEELRAVAPRPRSAAWLARRFEVSRRTVERDLDSLRQAGVPIWAEPGRLGGYTLDRNRTLPPLALTPGEALAVSVALRSVSGSPFADDARNAALKLHAVLPCEVREREEELARQVHVVDGPPPPAGHQRVIGEAVRAGRVVRMTYRAPSGQRTERDIEPLVLLWGEPGWYLLGWCRLRAAIRGFRMDRIETIELLAEIAPARPDGPLRRELARVEARSFAPL